MWVSVPPLTLPLPYLKGGPGFRDAISGTFAPNSLIFLKRLHPHVKRGCVLSSFYLKRCVVWSEERPVEEIAQPPPKKSFQQPPERQLSRAAPLPAPGPGEPPALPAQAERVEGGIPE